MYLSIVAERERSPKIKKQMPYKNIEERRAKQKLYRRRLRDNRDDTCFVFPVKVEQIDPPPSAASCPEDPSGRQTMYALSSRPNKEQMDTPPSAAGCPEIETSLSGRLTINALSSREPQEPTRPWGWTIHGVFVPLQVRPEMPFGYR